MSFHPGQSGGAKLINLRPFVSLSFNKFSSSPYKIDYIDYKQKTDTIEILKNTKDDIISAELVTTTDTIDYHNEIQKLCGPLGDFYDDTVNEINKDNLLIYLKHTFFSHEIKSLNIMTADGEEHNLLE